MTTAKSIVWMEKLGRQNADVHVVLSSHDVVVLRPEVEMCDLVQWMQIHLLNLRSRRMVEAVQGIVVYL